MAFRRKWIPDHLNLKKDQHISTIYLSYCYGTKCDSGFLLVRYANSLSPLQIHFFMDDENHEFISYDSYHITSLYSPWYILTQN